MADPQYSALLETLFKKVEPEEGERKKKNRGKGFKKVPLSEEEKKRREQALKMWRMAQLTQSEL